MIKLLVQCGTRTKKMQVEEKAFDKIVSVIIDKFGQIENFHLQYYDKEVSEYVDLDVESVPELDDLDYNKIKLVTEKAFDKVIVIEDGATGTSTPKNDNRKWDVYQQDEGVNTPVSPDTLDNSATTSMTPETPVGASSAVLPVLQSRKKLADKFNSTSQR